MNGASVVFDPRLPWAVVWALGALALAVTAVSDEQRGEQLVVLYTPEAGPLEKLMSALRESELPNLWKPAAEQFHAVECLPVLGTGKLDLAALKALAVQCCSTKSESTLIP
mgnify:CR=1 FL=1